MTPNKKIGIAILSLGAIVISVMTFLIIKGRSSASSVTPGGASSSGSPGDIVSGLQFDGTWGSGAYRAITRGELDKILSTMSEHYNNGYWRTSLTPPVFIYPYVSLSGQTYFLKTNDNGGLFKSS